MRITRHPAQGGAPRDAALERAESGINHTRYCSACGIPSRFDLCRVCAAWIENYRHTRAALKALNSIEPRPLRLRLVRSSS
jgi:hypothetical protein